MEGIKRDNHNAENKLFTISIRASHDYNAVVEMFKMRGRLIKNMTNPAAIVAKRR
jgi:hypothetical protein